MAVIRETHKRFSRPKVKKLNRVWNSKGKNFTWKIDFEKRSITSGTIRW